MKKRLIAILAAACAFPAVSCRGIDAAVKTENAEAARFTHYFHRYYTATHKVTGKSVRFYADKGTDESNKAWVEFQFALTTNLNDALKDLRKLVDGSTIRDGHTNPWGADAAAIYFANPWWSMDDLYVAKDTFIVRD